MARHPSPFHINHSTCYTGLLVIAILLMPGLSFLAQTLPNLEWSTYHGGSLEDGFRDMAIDREANIYVTGSTLSANAIATAGSHQVSPGGLSDVYIAKYNADGMLMWSTYFGGFQNDYGQSITVDGLGNIYVTGFTASNTGIATPGAYQMTNNGGFADAFIAKFDPDGNRLWSTYFGGTADERANSICVDNAGNVTIIGWTNSSAQIASPGAFQTSFQGQQDIFLAHFNTSGTRLWSTYFGFDGFDIGLQVMADAANDLFISGWTSSTSNMTTAGAYKTTYSGGTADTYLAKFTETGSRLWCTYYGGSIDEYGDALLVTADGDLYLAGPCNSPDGISTPGAYQASIAGGFDSFLARFDANGMPVWGTYYGGNNDDLGYGLATDSEKSIYLTGYTQSINTISTPNAHQTVSGGDWDAFVARFTADGTRLWGTYFGGSATDQSLGVEVDTSGYVYISGLTVSSNQISTTGSYQETYGGGNSDGFVSKFSPCTDPVVSFNNGGYLCSSSNFVFDLSFTGSPPYTILYSLDGVEQPPVSSDTSVLFHTVIAPWSDSIKLLSVSSGPCMGLVTGTFDFVKIVEPLIVDNINILCDQDTETYTVSGDLSGGIFNYISIGSTNIFIAGNQFTSNSLPFNIPFDIAITSGLNCDTIIIAGPSGCKVQCPASIGTIIPDTLVCEGIDIMLYAEGGTSYLWEGPFGFSSTLQNPVIAGISTSQQGTYTLTITDDDGCMDTLFTTVMVQTVNGSISSDPEICTNDDLVLQATGGISYEWSGPGGFTSGTSNPVIPSALITHSGSYAVTITDALGCILSLSTDVLVHPLPNVIISSNSPVCEGTDIQLQASGGVDYAWSGPDAFMSSAQNPSVAGAQSVHQGTYTVVVTDANGCSSTGSTVVEVTAAPVISIIVNGTLCEGTNFGLVAAGATTWEWSGPNGFSSTLADPVIPNAGPGNSGLYTVIGIAAGGCRDTASQSVTILALPVVMITAQDTTLCQGEQLQLNVNSAVAYQWSGPGGFSAASQNPSIAFITPAQSGLYSVTVTDANMCTAQNELEIIVHPAPVIDISGGQFTACEGGIVWVEVSGDVTQFSWSGPNGFSSQGNMLSISGALNSANGWYVVNGINMEGCADMDSVEFIISPVPIATITGPDEICAGETVILEGSGGSVFEWNTGLQTPVLSDVPAVSMLYILVVGEGACFDTTEFFVHVNSIPELVISSPVTISQHETASLSISGAGTYAWEPPFTLDCSTCNETIASPDTTTLYCVTGDLNGCVSEACVLVTVIIDCRFSVPNVFSPNFDGANDLWCSPKPDCYDRQNLTIFDRWGNALFNASGEEVCWDGTSRGKEVPPGVYVYRLELKDGVNPLKVKHGDITVVR